jgi:RimJ/RimL family protein N-acetyltransferase
MTIEALLHTPRLVLFPLSVTQLGLALQDVALLAEEITLPIVPDLVTPPTRRAITMKLIKMTDALLADRPWYTYWLIVVKQDDVRIGAGMVGFKGAPDDAGSVEIGYGIDPAFRGKGYMTEAVRAMVDWAFQHEQCKVVAACGVLKTNPASSHVLQKVGMTLSGEDEESFSYQIDREDWEN